ncbi:MAG: hypothetical protein QOH41_730 [Blastocatellia bacterium]|jgi:hypothetical protein|nr:hypothetical protein [Blastocatellia bacterium]
MALSHDASRNGKEGTFRERAKKQKSSTETRLITTNKNESGPIERMPIAIILHQSQSRFL